MKIGGALTLVQAIICVEKGACLWSVMNLCGNISFGNDSKIRVKGKCNILIRLRE